MELCRTPFLSQALMESLRFTIHIFVALMIRQPFNFIVVFFRRTFYWNFCILTTLQPLTICFCLNPVKRLCLKSCHMLFSESVLSKVIMYRSHLDCEDMHKSNKWLFVVRLVLVILKSSITFLLKYFGPNWQTRQ